MAVTAADSLLEARKRRRLRELSRYYCATAFLASTGKQLPNGQVPSTPEVRTSRPVQRDRLNQAHLTALAQLAAFRLGTERSIISIIDDKTQFIVAEATRSSSLYDSTSYDLDDAPLIGPRAIALDQGVCPNTLDAFLGVPLPLQSPHNSADRDHVVITDLLEERLTCGRPLLKTLPPVLRYYLDVPLRTASGHVLGTICVVDSIPRVLGPTDVAKLTEVANLVVEHLESTRLKQDHVRAQRLLEGLSHFVRGQGSLSDWSREAEGQDKIPNAFPTPVAVSAAALAPKQVGTDATVSSQLSTESTTEDSIFTSSDSIASTIKTTEGRSTANTLSMFDQEEETTNPGNAGTATNDSASSSLPTSDSTLDTNLDTVPTHSSSQARQAFSRASNLIRESMDLDATCFLELPQNDRYKHSPPTLNKRKEHTPLSESPAEDSDFLTDSSIDAPSKDSLSDGSSSKDSKNSSYCYRLGFSTGTNSSLASSSVTSRFLTIPAELLNRLSQRYPEGHIFHFDAAGHISSSGDESSTSQTNNDRRRRRREIGAELVGYFPTARSMIFFPLYDNDRQHVYATFIGWTANPARALQPEETIYVSAFANSVMCEVMRLSATTMDKAKSNFISSISHELRSPLHGILAACQLLGESEQFPHQGEFINMVDTCAHTLLDTMDHVLDYAKINHFTEEQKKRPLSSRPRLARKHLSQAANFSLVTRIDLRTIIEDTVSSMAASSQHSSTQRDSPPASQNVLKSAESKSSPTLPLVPIVLNFAPCASWTFNSEPGAWRRIVMNLIGNSLKYTQNGHIKVDVRCYENKLKKTKKTHTIELRIMDTGQGISEEYLRHRLYTPFAQENNLSVGTGLGLSMVNQIVASLQGQMQVHSEVGTGTEIIVKIPLEEAEITELTSRRDGNVTQYKGRSVAFVGFDGHPPLSESSTGLLSSRAKALLAIKKSLAETATSWMGINVVPSNPDIYVIEESFLGSHMEEFDQQKNSLLVVGLDGWQSRITDRIGQAKHHYLVPAIGPKQMSEAFRVLFNEKAIVPSVSEVSHGQQIEPTIPFKSSQLEHEANSVGDHLNTTDSKAPVALTLTVNNTAMKDGLNHMDDSGATVPEDQYDNTSPTDLETSPDTTPFSPNVCTAENTEGSVLLVDDNDINLRILVTCVKRLKTVHWMTASNGKEALDIYQTAIESGKRIPLIFMDVSMPVMDGMQSTREIRTFEKRLNLSRGKRSKIIALTGLGSAEAQSDINASGFDVYLRKPVNLTVVRDILTDSGMYSEP